MNRIGDIESTDLTVGLCVGDREPRANCQRGELIDRIAAGPPVRKLLFVRALRHVRMSFGGNWPDHRGGVDPPTVDTHRAAEAGADVESGFDDRIPAETRQDRFEVADFPGQAAAGHSASSSLGQVR